MRIHIYLAVTALAFFAFLGSAFAGSAMHVKIAKEHCDAMITAGEDALDHGQKGHPGKALDHLKMMIKEAEECVNHGQEGINASDATKATRTHGGEAMEFVKEAIDHARTAVKHGEAGRDGIMMDHAQDALMHALEGNKHAREMG
ncbi:MAG: small metal-binding protein SmbP [Nitrospiria bacterium]